MPCSCPIVALIATQQPMAGDLRTIAIERANYLLWVAHNLERAADWVTNICERVIFTVTGEMVDIDAEDSELEGIT